MGPKASVSEGDLCRCPSFEQITLEHPPVHLADSID
jgi:hypothetical protein